VLTEIAVVAAASIAASGSLDLQQLAHPALAGRKLLLQPAGVRPPVYELRPFLAITAFSISRSEIYEDPKSVFGIRAEWTVSKPN